MLDRSRAYYNEIDRYCCDWLQNLMDAGHITPGRIDDRSIEDVRPEELAGYERCHFFAGIGVWDYALNQAGWTGPIWTGSCPCQPFSAAGKGKGFDDERHLWPSWYWLIEQCRPSVVVGEQVASKRTEPWIDLVQADLEAMGYAFGCIPFPSAGVGAPHIRDRAYWVGHSQHAGLERHAGNGGVAGRQGTSGPVAEAGVSGRMADARFISRDGRQDSQKPLCEEKAVRGQGGSNAGTCGEPGGMADAGMQQRQETAASGDEESGREQEAAEATGLCGDSGMGHTFNNRRQPQPQRLREHGARVEQAGREQERGIETGSHVLGAEPAASPTNGHWRDADWLMCRDGKWRPVEPGTFPLVDGAPARVGRLRAYGNAINAEAARVFVQSLMETGYA